jgi:hypothetical protein
MHMKHSSREPSVDTSMVQCVYRGHQHGRMNRTRSRGYHRPVCNTRDCALTTVRTRDLFFLLSVNVRISSDTTITLSVVFVKAELLCPSFIASLIDTESPAISRHYVLSFGS